MASVLDEYQPSLIINAAAFTQVDEAESQVARAHAVNAEGPAQLAAWCARQNVSLIHVSTDYVFNGRSNRPWIETDEPNPVNVYGASKLAGERAIQESGCHHYIFRTAWLYAPGHACFVRTIRSRAREGHPLRVVNDQYGSPTAARDLAKVISSVLVHTQFKRHSGIYHATNRGQASWFELARAATKDLPSVDLEPISSELITRPAQRPSFSVLNVSKLNTDFAIVPRTWEEALTSELPRFDTGNAD